MIIILKLEAKKVLSKVYQKLHESSKKVHVHFENRESGGLLATLQDLLFGF